MWLLRRFVLRQLAGEPLRTAATVAGVAIGIAVVIAVRLANQSSLRGFETALETMAGKTSLEVVGSGLGIDESRIADLAWLRTYGEISPIVEGDALHGGRQGELLRVLGVDILRDRPFREYQLLDLGPRGRQPTSQEFLDLLLDPRTIIVTEKFARRLGLHVGQSVVLTIGDRDESFVVGGRLRDEGPARALDGNVILMDIAAAQWAFRRLGRIDRLDVRLSEPSAIERVEAEVAARMPPGLRAQRPARRAEQAERMLASFHLNLTALSCIALLVGLFLVYNTISISVVARREEVGTLRALGATRRQVVALFLCEALALALAGCGLGVVLGRVLAAGAVQLTATTVNVLYIASAAAGAQLERGDVATAFAVGVPLALLAAAVPALEASRVSPMAAIRGADRIETRYRLAPRRLAIPAGLFAAGAWLTALGPVRGIPVAGFAAAFAFVFAAAFLVPAVLFVLGRLSRRVVVRCCGVEGFLAHGNLAGDIPRLSISVAALAVSLSMMVAIAIMIGSFRETVVYWVGQTLTADLFIGPAARSRGARQTAVSPAVERVIRTHPAIEEVDALRSLTVDHDGAQVLLNASDFSTFAVKGGLVFKSPANAEPAILAAMAGDSVLVSEAFSIRHGKGIGDALALATPKGTARFAIAGIYFDYTTDKGVISMDSQAFARHFGAVAPTGLAAHLRSGSDADQVRADLFRQLPAGHEVYIYTNGALRREVLRIFDATFAITYALEVIAIVVAIMGVAGTLLTLVLERRRELAVLRLIGAERRQVRRMVVLEAAMLGGVSQVIGLAVGVLLSVVLIFVINVQSFGWTIRFHVPTLFLAQMSLAILVATALSGLWPAHRAAQLSLPQQVSEE